MPHVDFRLCLVTDRHQTRGRPLVPVLDEALAAGVPAIQLRERDLSTNELFTLAQDLIRLSQSHRATLLINDRLDLAMAVDAAGVHLRANSLPLSVARRVLGSERLLGISTHSIDDVLQAEAEGADYVVLGPIYDTPSKREHGAPLGLQVLEGASRRVRIPIVAIGGITAARAGEVRRAGAFGVAVISAILNQVSVSTAVQTLLDAVNAPA